MQTKKELRLHLTDKKNSHNIEVQMQEDTYEKNRVNSTMSFWT